jgi:hypothetical protein
LLQTLLIKASRLPTLVGDVLAPPLGLKGQSFDSNADKQQEVCRRVCRTTANCNCNPPFVKTSVVTTDHISIHYC